MEPELTVRECLELYAGYYAAPLPVEDVIELVGLGSKAGVEAGLLSGGQQRRLDVALALIGDRSACSWTSRRRASTPPPGGVPGR